MKFGIRIPVPQFGPIDDPDYVARFAQLVEEVGFESVWTIDHALMNVEYSSRYPHRKNGRTPLPTQGAMPDPLMLLAHLAGVTKTLRLGTAMLVLPQRNPIILAKEVATLDRYSGGRVLLGVGVGWVREEMEALGFDFSNRGKRTDEYIDVLRELWRTDPSHFAGEFVAFDDVVSNPKPEQPGGVPLIIGGHSPAAARRAGRRGDGFYPHFSVKGPTRDEYLPVRDLMYEAAESAGRDPHDIEITLTGTTEPEVAELCLELGADRVVILPPHGDIDALADDLESFRQRVIEPLSGEPSAPH